ncbi:MAG: GGDEF domain-containing protein [Rubrivivax sp.]|nr:GGDEF domain-containing protein [Rubrivivax sp.]
MTLSCKPLFNWLLGTDPHQRLRASQSLLSLMVYALCIALEQAKVAAGMVAAADALPHALWCLLGPLGFFLAVRGGLNLRWRIKGDPGWTLPQTSWGMVAIVWAYGISGPGRGAALLILLAVLTFGAFSLRPVQARALALAGFAMLAATMAYKTATDTERYPPQVEVMHLLVAGIVMAVVSELAVRMAALRQRLQDQRGDLRSALDRIQEMSTRDELTGLLNRRAVTERLHRAPPADNAAVGQADSSMLLSLAMIDLDHFKQVNDSFGHAVGDEVLRRFARCGQAALRGSDVLARWGGEEFLLLMPGTPAGSALGVLQRLREQLAQQRFDDLDAGLRVTFSVGIAECTETQALGGTIARADSAVYAAKHAGRNRTLLARPHAEAALTAAAATPASPAAPDAPDAPANLTVPASPAVPTVPA